MRILQLCAFTNLWSNIHQVESIDLKLKKNIFDLPIDYGKNFDLIISAPPCDQFTKVNAQRWKKNPSKFIEIAKRCLEISIQSGKIWYMENPPGRIEIFIPELTKYRLATINFNNTNKEYILYGNNIILKNQYKRYGHSKTEYHNKTKKQREEWNTDLIKIIENSIQ